MNAWGYQLLVCSPVLFASVGCSPEGPTEAMTSSTSSAGSDSGSGSASGGTIGGSESDSSSSSDPDSDTTGSTIDPTGEGSTGGSLCGNGFEDGPGEECDDGNDISDDGCEPDCTVSHPLEAQFDLPPGSTLLNLAAAHGHTYVMARAEQLNTLLRIAEDGTVIVDEYDPLLFGSGLAVFEDAVVWAPSTNLATSVVRRVSHGGELVAEFEVPTSASEMVPLGQGFVSVNTTVSSAPSVRSTVGIFPAEGEGFVLPEQDGDTQLAAHPSGSVVMANVTAEEICIAWIDPSGAVGSASCLPNEWSEAELPHASPTSIDPVHDRLILPLTGGSAPSTVLAIELDDEGREPTVAWTHSTPSAVSFMSTAANDHGIFFAYEGTLAELDHDGTVRWLRPAGYDLIALDQALWATDLAGDRVVRYSPTP